jgi:hypothetical protein
MNNNWRLNSLERLIGILDSIVQIILEEDDTTNFGWLYRLNNISDKNDVDLDNSYVLYDMTKKKSLDYWLINL